MQYLTHSCCALVPVAIGTQSVVQAKVLAELLALQGSGEENVFASWFLYLTLIIWAVTCVVWLKRLNDALKMFNPLFIIPLLQCSFIFFAIVSGGIFFKVWKRRCVYIMKPIVDCSSL